ncbi:MAG: endopeptidase La [Clostridia bacterium]|nr:endopeptidase La [Clostridia bacterium]
MDNEKTEIQTVPVLPLRGLVIFPGSILHFDIARKKSVLAIKAAMNADRYIFITSQKDALDSDPSGEDLCKVGVYTKILQIAKMPDNVLRVVAEGMYRAKAESFLDNPMYFEAAVKELPVKKSDNSEKIEAMMNTVKDMFNEFSMMNSHIPQDMILTVHDTNDAGFLSDYIADNVIRDYHKKREILETLDEEIRIEKIITMFRRENNVLAIEETINERTRECIEGNQKEYYLRERLKAIHDELGDNEDFSTESYDYKEKILNIKTTDENKEKLLKEVQKLEKMSVNSAEANVVRNYLDTCIDLPWGVYTKEKIDIKKINTNLDKNHYGLKKVKENVIEALAVRKLNPDINGQIICLAGPPGVGKTSIAHSIADTIGRKYQRIALGGVHDEAEIRGHRRTYIGAMMGRIMYAVKQSGSANPLILLDEIDKLGKDFHGDPTSALLEVLDGEQNSTFYDHYIDLPFDLSKVMFITTANDYTAIPAPLLDRMDIIQIDSYTREEKFNIAKLHLISKQLKKHGLNARQFKITDEAVYDIIDSYTRESGVRSLERTISKIMNKVAVKIVSGELKSVKITLDNIEEYLGSRKYKNDTLGSNNEVGLVTGLAWTSVGGETLPVEVAVMNGSGKLELTGSLGDVMKESAQAAYTCVRTMTEKLNIDKDFYKNKDIHIHVPEGAVPKDGPSAGITMATAIASALTGIPVRRDLAMTGEITIRGRVLPIGGLKEKTMAAYRLGIKTIIIPQDNRSDLDEVDEIVKNSVEFVLADNIDTVLKTALISENN